LEPRGTSFKKKPVFKKFVLVGKNACCLQRLRYYDAWRKKTERVTTLASGKALNPDDEAYVGKPSTSFQFCFLVWFVAQFRRTHEHSPPPSHTDMVELRPIRPVPQNNATPWLPPMKTSTSLQDLRSGSSGTTEAPASPDFSWLAGMQCAPAALPDQRQTQQLPSQVHDVMRALVAASSTLQNQQPAGMFASHPLLQKEASGQSSPLSSAYGSVNGQDGVGIAHVLDALQREREQLNRKALQNELLMQSFLSATTSVPRVADPAMWPSMPIGVESAFGSSFVSPVADDSDDASSTCSGKRTRRESSADSEGARKKRVYARSACEACRAAHLACDDSQPCRNCMRSGSQCHRTVRDKVYVPPSNNGFVSDRTPFATGSNSPETSQRKYVKAACMCCRRSHLACDNYRPCRNCVRMSLPCEEVRSQRRTSDSTYKRRRAPRGRLVALQQLVSAA
jgi:hypothetical protein